MYILPKFGPGWYIFADDSVNIADDIVHKVKYNSFLSKGQITPIILSPLHS